MCQRLKQRGSARKGMASGGFDPRRHSLPNYSEAVTDSQNFTARKTSFMLFLFFLVLRAQQIFFFYFGILQFGEINVSSQPFLNS